MDARIIGPSRALKIVRGEGREQRAKASEDEDTNEGEARKLRKGGRLERRGGG